MYLSDMNTHSIASGHGTSCTISEMAKIASRFIDSQKDKNLIKGIKK